MILPRHIGSLGLSELGWIRAYHHFQFAGAQDVDLLEWQRVRAINHNTLAVAATTTPATHHGTEVIYIVEGGAIDLVRDSGKKTRVIAGQILSIYAGSGIHFSNANVGAYEAVYTETWLTCDGPHDAAVVRRLCQSRTLETHIIAGSKRNKGSFRLKCPATMTRHFVPRGDTAEIVIAANHAYAFVQTGAFSDGDTRFAQFDGIVLQEEHAFHVACEADTSLVLIEMFG